MKQIKNFIAKTFYSTFALLECLFPNKATTFLRQWSEERQVAEYLGGLPEEPVEDIYTIEELTEANKILQQALISASVYSSYINGLPVTWNYQSFMNVGYQEAVIKPELEKLFEKS